MSNKPTKVDIFMQFFVGDYLADTMHLTTQQHGAYLLLIFAYWRNKGPLVDDDGELAAICRLSLSDWGAIRKTIARFFQSEGGVWRHKRIELELLKATAQKRAKQKGAHMTNKKRWSHSVSLSESLSESQSASESESQSVSPSPSPSLANPNQNQYTPSLRSTPKKGSRTKRAVFVKPSVEEVEEYCKSRNNDINAAAWIAKQETIGWKVGKNGLPMLDWKASIRTWEINAKEEKKNGKHHAGATRTDRLDAAAAHQRELWNLGTSLEVCP